MIEQITKFMSLVPLMLPDLINDEIPQDSDIIEGSAILEFNLKEPWNIGLIIDTITDNAKLPLLYHATDKNRSNIHHCCFYSPLEDDCLYKLNIVTNDHAEVTCILATIFKDLIIMEDCMLEDLQRHNVSFDFIQAMTASDVTEQFVALV